MNKSRILTILPGISALFCVSCGKIEHKDDAGSYESLLKQCREESDFHSELYIFPETTQNGEAKGFYYAHQESMFTGSFFIYLVMKYDQTNFENEIDRISHVKAQYKTGETKSIIPFADQNLYLTIKKDNRYEYAMYNSSSLEIAYVSNQLFEWKDIPIKNEHILPDVIIPAEVMDQGNGYTLYYLYDGDVGMYIED